MPLGKPQDMPVSTCARCGVLHDLASALPNSSREKPEPGDLTVCIVCGAINKFDSNLKLSMLNLKEWEQIRRGQPELAAELRQVRLAQELTWARVKAARDNK